MNCSHIRLTIILRRPIIAFCLCYTPLPPILSNELEPEAVAYVVSAYSGFRDPSSHNFLALWHADAEKITARADRTPTISAQIINSVER